MIIDASPAIVSGKRSGFPVLFTNWDASDFEGRSKSVTMTAVCKNAEMATEVDSVGE